MSNTAFIESNDSLSDGSTHIICIATDNISIKTRVDRYYSPGTTVEQFKRIINSILVGAVASDELKKLPINAPIDLAPEIIIPTPEEQARIDFNNAVILLQKATGYLNLGIFDSTLPEYQALLVDAQKKFKPEYITS